MRAPDFLKLALKSLRGRGTALPALGFAVGMFCLCVAGAVQASIRLEKSQPCELTATVQSSAGISAGTLGKLPAIAGVTASTAVLSVPMTVKSGEYSAELTLTGLDAAYIEGAIKQGGAFPNNSVMPYIVLNEAACKLFTNGEDDTDIDSDSDLDDSEDGTNSLPPIDWLNARFTVQQGSARPVVAKVCGVIPGDDKQQPAAYTSLSSAKQLLQAGEEQSAVTEALVRVRDLGTAKSAGAAIAALGLSFTGSDDALQTKWDEETHEMTYLIVTGAFALLCTAALLSALNRNSLLEDRDSWNMLLWLGLNERGVRGVFALQAAVIALFGVAIGMAVAFALPSFLPPELKGESVFMLPIPLESVIASVVVCIILPFSLCSNIINKGFTK